MRRHSGRSVKAVCILSSRLPERQISAYCVKKLPTSALSNIFGDTPPLLAHEIADPGVI